VSALISRFSEAERDVKAPVRTVLDSLEARSRTGLKAVPYVTFFALAASAIVHTWAGRGIAWGGVAQIAAAPSHAVRARRQC